MIKKSKKVKSVFEQDRKMNKWLKRLIIFTCVLAYSFFISAILTCPQSKKPVKSVSIGRFCSGYAVDNNLVMTAKHCVQELKIGTPLIVIVNNQKRNFILKNKSQRHDVAILEGPTTGIEIVKISNRQFDYNEIGIARGYPLGAPIEITSELKAQFWRGDYIYFEGQVDFGFSGSGIFDENGEIMAMTVMMSKFFTIGVAAPYLQSFLDETKNQKNDNQMCEIFKELSPLFDID